MVIPYIPIEELFTHKKKDKIKKHEVKKCKICCENEIDAAISNCGHVLCFTCVGKVSKCPFCRVLIDEKIKLYMN